MSKPNILLWDLETSLHVMAGFGIWQQNIPTKHILEEWYIICGAWKWYGEDKVHAVSTSTKDDSKVIKRIHKELMKADIIVAHNGDKFDIKKFETRCLYHGLEPLPKIVSVDTLKVAKKRFKFTSNRLDYIAKYLGVGAKLPTTDGLWLDVLRGNKKALKEMVEYNKVDVLVLEKVFDKLKPYIDTINFNIYTNKMVCKNCGSQHVVARGYAVTKVGKYQRYQCQECGGWSQSRLNTMTATNLREVKLK